MTDLIVEETRRIVKLLEQVEQFGNIRPPDRRAVNIHDALDRARTLGPDRLCQPHDDRRGLRPLAARDLGRPRPADAGVPEPDQERRRGRPRAAAPSACAPSTTFPCACAARTAPGPPCPCRSRSSTTAPASRPRSPPTSSSPSSRAARTAPGWGWRWCPRSSPTMTAGFLSIPCRAARCSACRCRWPRKELEGDAADGRHRSGRR